MLRLAKRAVVAVPLLLCTLPAHAVGEFALQSDLDHVWVMVATALVFLMQCGFMMLEAGNVRTKNSVNVAQKNLIDFLISSFCFGLVGYAIMFGPSQFGWFGWDWSLAAFGVTEEWSLTFFVFQMVFCGTAATIVSGAVAERMSLGGYISCTALIALLIYPVSGHWAWGGLLTGDEAPFLAAMGFMDFAGGTVVHGVGAAVALAAVILVGPRKGRFDADGNVIKIRGHSPILATLGALLIWVGWIGFNGGSTTVGSGAFAEIVYVTMIGGVVGGLVGMTLGYAADHVWAPQASINGVIAGLVGVTAGADVLTGQTALVLGGLAAVVAFLCERWLLERWKLDDPVGAISAHGAAGLFGTFMVAVFAPVDALLAGDRVTQMLVQLAGMGAIMAWAFGVAFLGLRAIGILLGGPGRGLRVPEDHEDAGLNAAEHDAPMGTGILETALVNVLSNDGPDFQPIILEPGDEAYEMSVMLNEIMLQLSGTLDSIADAVARAADGDFAHRVPTEARTGAALRLCNGINQINETCQKGLDHVSSRMVRLAEGNLLPSEPTDLRGQFGEMCTTLEESIGGLRNLIQSVEGSFRSVDEASGTMAHLGDAIEEDARRQGEWVEQATAGMTVLSQTSQNTLETATKAAQKSAEASAAAAAGRTTAEAANSKMAEVAGMTKGISSAVESIESIASQINILAINASIEAERGNTGGENTSAGFKVVAKEVRSLAERTAAVVGEIRNQTEDINAAVKESSSLVDDVSSHIKAVHNSVQANAEIADHVAQVGRAQLEQVDQVASAIDSVKQGSLSTISRITESNDASAAVSEEAQRTKQLMENFVTSQEDPNRRAA